MLMRLDIINQKTVSWQQISTNETVYLNDGSRLYGSIKILLHLDAR